jgi:transposase-like protein
MGIETESTATATQIAKEIGIDKSTLSKWRKRPDCPPLSAGSAAIKRWHDNTFLDRGAQIVRRRREPH